MMRSASLQLKLKRLLFSLEPVDWREVKRILDSGIDYSMNPRKAGADWPLVWEMARAPHKLFVECVERGMPLVARHAPMHAVERALSWGCEDNLRVLVGGGAPVNCDRRQPQPWHALFYWVLGPWITTGSRGWEHTPGPRFVSAKWRRMLRTLLDAGASIDAYSGGATPLLFCLVLYGAASEGQVWQSAKDLASRALMLIDAGADVNAPLTGKRYEIGGRWPRGATPLFARPIGDGRVHRAMLKSGADPLKQCLLPVPWNAIEFAEMSLHRLKTNANEYLHPESGKELTFDRPPMPDDVRQVARLIEQMKRMSRLHGRSPRGS